MLHTIQGHGTPHLLIIGSTISSSDVVQPGLPSFEMLGDVIESKHTPERRPSRLRGSVIGTSLLLVSQTPGRRSLDRQLVGKCSRCSTHGCIFGAGQLPA